MYKLILPCMLLLGSLQSMAQSEKKSSAYLTIGPSIPTGDFALKDFSDKAGQATTGVFVDLGYRYSFSKYFGAAVLFKGSVNGIDFSGYQAPSGVGATMSTHTTNWRSAAIMAGLFQQIPVTSNGKFIFEINALAGLQRTSSPETEISISIPGMSPMNAEQESYSASSFAYLVGAALRYKLSDVMGLKLSADYNSSEPTFKVNGINIVGQDVIIDSKQRTSKVDLGLGLTVSF